MNPATGAGPLREVKRGALPLANDYPSSLATGNSPGCAGVPNGHGGPRDGAGAQPGGRGARPHAWEPAAAGGAERLGRETKPLDRTIAGAEGQTRALAPAVDNCLPTLACGHPALPGFGQCAHRSPTLTRPRWTTASG